MTAILQKSGSDNKVMDNLMGLDEITRGIYPYCPYKCFHGGSTCSLRYMSLLARNEGNEPCELLFL